MRPLPARSSEAGMSAVEIVIMAAIMSLLMIMITESLSTLSGVRKEQRASFRIADVADRVARVIEDDVEYASRIFCDTEQGRDYLAAMQTPISLVTSAHRLPALTDHGYFSADTLTPETGNVLFMARRGPKVKLEHLATEEYLVQCWRFVIYAPVTDDGVLELMRWTSELVVNYWDLAEISDETARADVITQLWENGVFYAWDPLSARNEALWRLEETGTLVVMESEELVSGSEDKNETRPFGKRMMQIAENGRGTPHPVPAYAQAIGTFPGGFELKVDGGSAGKLLLFRLVVRSNQPRVREVTNMIQRLFHTDG